MNVHSLKINYRTYRKHPKYKRIISHFFSLYQIFHMCPNHLEQYCIIRDFLLSGNGIQNFSSSFIENLQNLAQNSSQLK